MGTSFVVKAELMKGPSSREQVDVSLAKVIDRELKLANHLFNTWESNSVISKWNATKSTEKQKVPELFFRLVEKSLVLSDKTAGAFDVTCAPLFRLWGFYQREKNEKPTDERIRSVLDQVGYRKLELIQSNNLYYLIKKHPDVEIELSSIAKGWAVDRIAEAIEKELTKKYLVEIGGEVRVGEAPRGRQHWYLGILEPSFEKQGLQKTIAINDRALASSGDYFNYKEINGRFYTHIIDVKSGKPIRHQLAAVSVISEECQMADAWATALMAMGPNAQEVVLREKLNAFLVYRDPETKVLKEWWTEGFEAYIEK